MAFPSVINSATTVAASGTTTVAITMPSSIVAGRLLLLVVQAGAFNTTTTAAGWTQIGSTVVGGTFKIWVFGKIAAGSDTCSLTRSNITAFHTVTRQIDTWSGSLSDVSVAGATASADPPALTPAGGSKDFLWVAARAVSGNSAASGAPTNYTDLVSLASATTSWTLDTASRQLTASSEDPGTFSGGVTASPSSATISVAPGVSTAVPTPMYLAQAVMRATTR